MNKNLLLILFCCFVSLNGWSIEKDSIFIPKPSKKTRTNVKQLASHITKGLDTDNEKAYYLFYWICHNIKWDVKTFNKSTKFQVRTPKSILKEKRGYSQDFASLYQALGKYCDLKIQMIYGYEKNDLHTEGTHFYEPNHAWNAVFLDNHWQIVDPFNAAGGLKMDLGISKKIKKKVTTTKIVYSTQSKFEFRYDATQYLINPETFRLTRLAADPLWQLTDSAMPMQVFERNEEDIIAFNKKYSHSSKSKQNTNKLSELNDLSESEIVLESADRIYTFNPRYTQIKASKHIAKAEEGLKQLKLPSSREDASSILDNAKNELVSSKDILGNQKKQVKEECVELQKINTEKSNDAVKFKQAFTSLNKKYVAEAKTKYNTADTKIKATKNEVRAVSKKANNAYTLNSSNAKQMPANASSAIEEKRQLDSLQARDKRLSKTEEELIRLKLDLESYDDLEKDVASSIQQYHKTIDADLIAEAQHRSRQHNNVSDSIRSLRSNLNFNKTVMLDSLQNEYFDLYDSIVSVQAQQKKQFNSRIELSKANALSCLTLKKMSSKDPTIDQRNKEYIDKHVEASKNEIDAMVASVNFLNKQQPLLKYFQDKYNNENKFFIAVAKNEDSRKKFVKEIIKKKEVLRTKHCAQSISNVDAMKNDLTKAYTKLNKKNSSRKNGKKSSKKK
jgi:hypothetical protein